MHAHAFSPSSHPDYNVCECGTMHRLGEVDYDAFYLQQYWDREGYSNLEAQIYNVCEYRNEAGESKIESVLKHIPNGHRAVEIACAPGSLLKSLTERFDYVTGVEYDRSYEHRIRAICGHKPDLIFKPFPEATKIMPSHSCDAVIGLDVAEHVEDTDGFFREVHRLLKLTGTAILMAPILLEDGLFREIDRHPEHVWLYSKEFLQSYLSESFEEVSFGRWVTGHEYVVLRNPILGN